MRYKIYDITGELATDADSGQRLYDDIHSRLVASETVELDFAGVQIFSSAFFNVSIGQLLADLSPDMLNQLLSIHNLSGDGHSVLKRVIDNAKQYYGDRQYQEAVDDVLEEYAASL